MALMVLMDNLVNFLDNGVYILGIFLDFSTQFDTVDHGVLLQRLPFYLVLRESLIRFRSYIANKYQFVAYNGVSSEKSALCLDMA